MWDRAAFHFTSENHENYLQNLQAVYERRVFVVTSINVYKTFVGFLSEFPVFVGFSVYF